MRLTLTLLLVFVSLFSYSQQVPRQKVIVEVGTGTWCGACPAVVEIIEDLLAEDAQIAVVEYHIGDDYENSDGGIRKVYYDFPWYPTTYYDSEHIGYDDWATYSVHKEYYEDRWATLSSFTVAISGDIDGNTVTGNIIANKVSSYLTDELTLHVVLTESNIEENWQGLSELDFVERKMFPDGNGTAVNFSETPLSVDFTFEMDPSWEQENCKLVFFLQDNNTKEIVQGDQIDLPDLPLQTGIASLPVRSEIEIFPNPFTETINIVGEDVDEVIVTDITGRRVFSSDQILEHIDTSYWGTGMYFVTTISGDQRSTIKVIKK